MSRRDVERWEGDEACGTGEHMSYPIIEVDEAAPEFHEWDRVLALLRAAFAYQEQRIDPPSSVYALDAESLAAKACREHVFLASVEGALAGCVFVQVREPALYVSKLAVWPHLQGRGVGRRLMQAVETFARASKRLVLELETRIDLVENHRTFESLGYERISEHAHEGYDRVTYIRMQRRVG